MCDVRLKHRVSYSAVTVVFAIMYCIDTAVELLDSYEALKFENVFCHLLPSA